jgi:hypothetical protein
LGYPDVLELVLATTDVSPNMIPDAYLDSSLLGWAADANDLQSIKVLLNHGADINGADGYSTSLTRAIEKNHPQAARMLLENGAEIQGYSEQYLFKILQNNYTSIYYSDTEKEQMIALLKNAKAIRKAAVTRLISPHIPITDVSNIVYSFFAPPAPTITADDNTSDHDCKL